MPPVLWRTVAFAVLVLIATWIGQSAVQRWERGLAEDVVIHRALTYARGAARLVEAGRMKNLEPVTRYGDAIGTGATDEVLRMLVVDTGTKTEEGYTLDNQVVWALDGTSGKVSPLDHEVKNRADRLADLFSAKYLDRPIKLTVLAEVATGEAGWFRVAGYAPVVVEGEYRGLAAALLRVPAPEASGRSRALLWGLAIGLILLFGGLLSVMPHRTALVATIALGAASAVVAVGLPSEINDRIRAQLVERADDMLSIQAYADSGEALALVSPISDREAWSPDGALRLERIPDPKPASALLTGSDRVGNTTTSVHVHPDIVFKLDTGLTVPLLLWILLAALLLGITSVPLARLLYNIRTDPGVYAYIAPAVIGLVVLIFVPFVTGVGLSFYRYHLQGNAYEFIGFGNFAEIISPQENADLHFWRTLAVTLLWTVSNVFLHVVIGLSLALLLNRPALKLKGLYRVLLVLPWAVPSYITALLWRGMFVGKSGPVNSLLSSIGLGPVNWFDNGFLTNFIPNLVTNVWLGFPFMMVVCLGALQSIPRDLYEAAELDGASACNACS